MRLLELELKNIKAFEEATICFGPGVNGLLGKNGSGKSTILQAVGYALFNHLSPAVKDFTREGYSRGSIRVRMRSARDQLTYDIYRNVGGGAQSYVYNCDEGFKVIEGNTDVLAFVQEHLGTLGALDMKTLFRDAVGIDQGTFQAPFLMGPALRKDHFGPLLGIEKYRRIDADLNNTRSYAQTLLTESQARLDRLDGQLVPLPSLSRRYAEIQTLVGTLDQEVDRRTKARDENLSQLEQLDGLERKVQANRDLRSKVHMEHSKLEDRTKSLEKELARAREAARQVELQGEAYRLFREADAKLALVEEKIRSQQAHQLELMKLQGEIGLLEKQIQELQQQIASFNKLKQKLYELEPAKSQAAALRTKLEQFPSHESRITALQGALNSLRQNLEWNGTRKKAIREELAKRHQTEELLNEVQTQLTVQANNRQILELQRNSVRTQLESLEQQLVSLRKANQDHSRLAQCPVCEQELSHSLVASLIERLETEIRGKSISGNGQLKEIEANAETQSLMETEREALWRKKERLSSQSDLEICLSDIERLRKEADEKTQELEISVQIQDTRNAALDELEGLRHSLDEWERIDRILATRSQLQANLEKLQWEHRNKTAAISEIEHTAELAEYLHDTARLLSQQKKDNQTGFLTYVTHFDAAERLSSLEDEAVQLEIEVARLNQSLADLESQQAILDRKYDRQQHESLKETAYKLNAELAGKEATLKAQQQNLANAESELKKLEVLALSRVQESETLTVLQARADRVVWMKELMRKALPRITSALIQNISDLANEFFCSMMGDHTKPLQWNSEFGIVLNVKGEERSFRQLSGGEQTAASLSIIMALLRRLSNVRFVFLDEPTSNLDLERRSQLASNLRNLGGLEQIFVVSHDDTFEEHLDHVVRLEAGPRGSRVVLET